MEPLFFICYSLGIIEEIDYFGLQYFGPKQEELWLNTRNRLCRQLPAGVNRMQFRVKFYVQPHMLQQSETRHQFFLNVRRQTLEAGAWSDEWLCNPESMAQALALAAVAGNAQSLSQLLAPAIRLRLKASGTEQQVLVRAEQLLSDMWQLSASKAEYRFLQLAAQLPMFGCHFYDAKDCLESKLRIAVGPVAICICDCISADVIARYAYPRVQKVTVADRVLYLSVSRDCGQVQEFGYKLPSARAANGLYRCITETHSFFRCVTVRADVTGHVFRGAKSVLQTLFYDQHDHDHCGKHTFAFDIQRTAKEVQDKATRCIYRCNAAAAAAAAAATCAVSDRTESNEKLVSEANELKVQLLLEQRLHQCTVCMDSSISCVLLPCGHAVTCANCATRLTLCVLCRDPIADRLPCHDPSCPFLLLPAADAAASDDGDDDDFRQ